MIRDSVEKLHVKKTGFWKTGTASWNRICILYARWVVEMEDVTPVNNATLCMNATRHDVVLWRGTVHKELLAA